MSNNNWWHHARSIVLLPVTVTVIIPWLLNRYMGDEPLFEMITYAPSRWIIGGLLGLIGLLLFCSTLVLFARRGKGTLAPWDPPQTLVTAGPYRWIRNPMISGVFFILLSEAVLLSSEYILIWAGVFFLFNHIYFILKEEPDLEKRFGDEYRDYKQHVPRWFPRFKP